MNQRGPDESLLRREETRSPFFCYPSYVCVIAVYAILGFRLFRLVSRNAVNLFTWDQWDFNNATLFQEHSLWEVFRWQHGPHRQGLGGIFLKFVGPANHWNTRYESFEILGIVLLTSILALILKWRLYREIGYTDVVIPLLFLTPIQYEILVGTTNPAHGSLPLLLMVLFCLAWTITENYWKYFWVLLVDFVMVYTGFGLFIGFVTPVLIAIDYYSNPHHRTARDHAVSIAGFGISVVCLTSFFAGYTFQSATVCFTVQPKNPISYLHFMSLMFADFIEVKQGTYLAVVFGGAILVAVLTALGICVTTLLRRRCEPDAKKMVMTALSSYCFLFALNTAYGRLCLGMAAAQSSRYMPYLITGFFALYLFSLSLQSRMWRNSAVLAVFLLAVLSSGRLNNADRWLIYGISRSRREWRDCYLAKHDIHQCDVIAKYPIHPNPQATHLQQKLDFLERNHLNLYSDKK